MQDGSSVKYDYKLKTRDEHIKDLIDPTSQYDLLIIGGGASGAGVALEASSRGLKCVVIEANDFASGTSSRSTKMAHGGVRYFEHMMFLQEPVQNYRLLKETLHERNYFLHAAPYMNKELGLVIPTKSLLAASLYYFPGMFLYHMIYMKEFMTSNYTQAVTGPRILTKKALMQKLPELKELHGQYGVLMYETQTLDSRFNMNVLQTSTIDNFIPGMKGANIINYMEFKGFIKNNEGKIEGAVLYDKIKKKEYRVKSKVVVNCTGIYSDYVRQLDNQNVEKRIMGARGTHLMLPQNLLSTHTGVILPKTKDGRLIYIINYLGHAMVGTTDEKCEITQEVNAPKEDVDFIIDELKSAFGTKHQYEKEVTSVWAGIRPLVKELEIDVKERKIEEEDFNLKIKQSYFNKVCSSIGSGLDWVSKNIIYRKNQSLDTASLVRNHVIEVSESGLVSLMGGKWTSFRKMGEETVDKIVKLHQLETKYASSQALKFQLIGSYSKVEIEHGLKQSPNQLYQQYEDHFVFHFDIPRNVAQHLLETYGTSSLRVLQMSFQQNLPKGKKNQFYERLHPDYPFIKAEIVYAIRQELCEKPNDIICRRVPIAIVNQQVARDLLPEVVEILAKEKKWSNQQKKEELEEAQNQLMFVK